MRVIMLESNKLLDCSQKQVAIVGKKVYVKSINAEESGENESEWKVVGNFKSEIKSVSEIVRCYNSLTAGKNEEERNER